MKSLKTASSLLRDTIAKNFPATLADGRVKKFWVGFEAYEGVDSILGQQVVVSYHLCYDQARVWSHDVTHVDAEEIPCPNHVESEFLTQLALWEKSILETVSMFVSGENIQRKRIDIAVKTLRHYARKKRDELFDIPDDRHDELRNEAITLERAAEIMASIDKII